MHTAEKEKGEGLNMCQEGMSVLDLGTSVGKKSLFVCLQYVYPTLRIPIQFYGPGSPCLFFYSDASLT